LGGKPKKITDSSNPPQIKGREPFFEKVHTQSSRGGKEGVLEKGEKTLGQGTTRETKEGNTEKKKVKRSPRTVRRRNLQRKKKEKKKKKRNNS